MMAIYLYFVKDCNVRIWGLTPKERTEKVLAGIATPVEDLTSVGNSDHVLILRGDYVLEDRLLKQIASLSDCMLLVRQGQNRVPVAANVSGAMAKKAEAAIRAAHEPAGADGLARHSLESISVSFDQKLRKFEPPFAVQVTENTAKQIERRLFDWSYKGVTDLVTKWLWPKPASWAVRQCVRLGIRPNQVTFAGFLLVILAGWLFARGYLGCGLLAGWLMTFLDTVDGKLARVTVTSSKFGHYFDHIIDLVHPPIWYMLWGMGLEYTGQYHLDISPSILYWLIFAGYILGRLVEGIFQWYVAGFEIFCWKPVDSFFRLVTARRNPCLILLTLFYLSGRPDLGFLGVAFWTGATTLFLLFRLFYALYEKSRHGSLRSWLQEIDWSSRPYSLAIRWFTRCDAASR